jgi:tetratricopeptide (TPR) repeat protein
MAFISLLVAALAAAVVGDPQGSGALTSAPMATATSEDLFAAYNDNLYSERYAEALVLASKLPATDGSRRQRALVLGMQGAALLGLKRQEESAKFFEQADAVAPEEAFPTKLRFRIGLLSNNMDVAADALDRMIARYPDVTREVQWRTLVFFLTNVSKSDIRRNEDRLIALARLGYGADADHGDQIAEMAVGALVKRGDVAGARELLPYIDQPRAAQMLLIQKRYAALWPSLEQQAGPHLKNMTASSVSNAERGYAAAPSDPIKLVQLVEAYRGAGRLDDAIALRAKLPATLSKADEKFGWAMNSIALALNEKGKIDEADQLFASLGAAEHEGREWRLNMKMNRLEFLVTAGRFERALSLLEQTQAVVQSAGNAHAEQMVRRLRYCTYHRLGLTDKASAILPELLAKASDAPDATIDALLCANDIDRAEVVTKAALADEAFEVPFVRMFQQDNLVGQSSTVWSAEWSKLRARPSIAAAFQKLARDLPKQFLINTAP